MIHILATTSAPGQLASNLVGCNRQQRDKIVDNRNIVRRLANLDSKRVGSPLDEIHERARQQKLVPSFSKYSQHATLENASAMMRARYQAQPRTLFFGVEKS